VRDLSRKGKCNSNLPRNGRRLAAVQQWSNEVRLCIISPNGAPGHFDAAVNGELLVRSSRTSFCDAARVLLDRGVDSNSWLFLRDGGSDINRLRGKVGVVAKIGLQRALDLMRRPNARLVRMHSNSKVNGVEYFVVPGGPVELETAEKIKAYPLVRGDGDALFPGLDQTWRMVAAVDGPDTLECLRREVAANGGAV